MSKRYVVMGKGGIDDDFTYLGTTSNLTTARYQIADWWAGDNMREAGKWQAYTDGTYRLSGPWADEEDSAFIGYAAPEYDFDQNGDL